MTLTETLQAVVDETLRVVRRQLAFGPKGILPPYGVMVKLLEDGPAELIPYTFLDIGQRYQILRKLVEDKQADGLMFMWEGFVEHGPRLRQPAVLVVSASAEAAKGFAVPFELSPFGNRPAATVEVPSSVVEEYRKLFTDQP